MSWVTDLPSGFLSIHYLSPYPSIFTPIHSSLYPSIHHSPSPPISPSLLIVHHLSLHPCFHPPISLSTQAPIPPSVSHHPTISSSVLCISILPSIHPSVHPPIHLYFSSHPLSIICPSLYPSMHPSFHPSISLPTHNSITFVISTQL